MRIVAADQALRELQMADGASPSLGQKWRRSELLPVSAIPIDTGRKIALARTIVDSLLPQGLLVLWITDWGVWPSSEHMDLFTRYRLALGEVRPLEEVSVHIGGTEDRDSLISILSLGLFFCWGMEVMSQDRSMLVTFHHDEWFDMQFSLDSLNRADWMRGRISAFMIPKPE